MSATLFVDAFGNDVIAFAAFHTLASPALRVTARGPLRRARHAARACGAPTDQRWCTECEATVDDLLLESFTRLRAAQAQLVFYPLLHLEERTRARMPSAGARRHARTETYDRRLGRLRFGRTPQAWRC